ncbi:hypothetical protein SAMN02745898_11858 [Streptomyces sp. 136MFCol5.1]|nr:hypothetical protein SAMN02745898_11858 [Streptomyces sp. 136MFCol5.1]
MSIRGKVAAVATVAGVILLLPGCSSAPVAPTSEQSAQASEDASVEAGRYARANLRAMAKTPDAESCRSAWDNLLDEEEKGLLYGTWMNACVNPATP